MALVITDGRRAVDKIAFLQCAHCTATVYIDGTNCQKTRDRMGTHSHCQLEEIGWYKASFSMGKKSKPCCGSCMGGYPNHSSAQANKVTNNYWKHCHQICPGCTVFAEIGGIPSIAVPAGDPAVAVAAHAPGVAAPTAAPTAQPPPPPFHPPNLVQEVQHLRGKVAELEAQTSDMQVAAEVTRQKFEETMVNLQLAMESKMQEQEQRSAARMDMQDDNLAGLQAQNLVMSKTIEELQLAMEAREAHEDCEDTYLVPHSVDQWENIKSSNPEDEERHSHDYGRLMR